MRNGDWGVAVADEGKGKIGTSLVEFSGGGTALLQVGGHVCTGLVVTAGRWKLRWGRAHYGIHTVLPASVGGTCPCLAVVCVGVK